MCDITLWEQYLPAYHWTESIPIMTQHFALIRKFPQGRDFYVRCFDFAFGECDYFPPLRVMAVTCAHMIVNLAFVSIRPLFEVHHGGAGRTAIHGLNLSLAHILCASPPFAYWPDA